MSSVLGQIGSRATPQGERTPGRSDEVVNSDGGYVFQIDDWARLDRFLVLGVDAGTYYTNARKLALDNAEVVLRCLAGDGRRTVDAAVAVSDAGSAPSNDPALFVLALAAAKGDVDVRRYALAHLRDVARIGTHLFHFVEYVQGHRGWGPQLVHAVGAWYLTRDLDDLANQLVKYRQRDGWSHRDVLRKAHPKADTPERDALLRFGAGQPARDDAPVHRSVEGYLKLQAASDPDEAAELVREYRLPWETVPSEFLAGDRVWRALLDAGALPVGALIRNLGVLSNRGILVPGATATGTIGATLTNEDVIRRARVHPIAILNALVTYRKGVSRGGVAWTPIPEISNALDAAFYLAFDNVEPTGKCFMLGIDVSASMTWQPCTGAAFDCREGAAAMAMVTDHAEARTIVGGFSNGFRLLDVSSRRRLDDNIRTIGNLPASSTDCAQPMLWATSAKADVDVFVVYTDNETNTGRVKPYQALEQYRQMIGHDAKLIVCGMTATGFSIADPKDPGMLDVVGFDTATPQVISGFAGQ